MKRWTLLLSLVAVLASPISHASFIVYGSGLDSCGSWVEHRKTTSDWYQAGQWINGYLTAAVDQTTLEVKEVDADAILIWVDNYCQANPLDNVLQAARTLLRAMLVES